MKIGGSISTALVALSCLFTTSVLGQLSGSVGPTTSTASKAAKKVCNVLNYGGVASTSSDLGPALASAFAACKSGGIVYVPPGNYGISTWQTLNGGTGWALQLDGIIYRTGTAGGHMIIVQNANDFEFFSKTSQGAMQGYGYSFLSQGTYGPRLVRIVTSNHFSFHDIKLIDSPAFHLILDNCQNGEVYNTLIRGANKGGLDGMDVSGSNIWVHDVEVTNKDECVTIKTPASNMLVENIYCNWSGGSAFGSLGSDTAISNIEYNNIYTWQSNQMIMIKSNGGDGYVRDCTFSNFIGHSNAYALDINEYWTDRALDPGNGVVLSNLKFSNFAGTVVDPKRATVQVLCADAAPCTGISLSNINLWSDTGAACHYSCESAYGSGACLRSGSGASYTSASTYSSAPAGATNAAKMPGDLASGLGVSVSIAIPATIPTSFYPGVSAISKLLNGSGGGAGATTVVGGGATSTTLKTTTTAATTKATATTTAGSGSGGSCVAVYGQCGGTGWSGATCCASGSKCTYSNDYYSQCLPS